MEDADQLAVTSWWWIRKKKEYLEKRAVRNKVMTWGDSRGTFLER